MQIFIKTIVGKTITLDVKPSDTIWSVKLKIEYKEGIEADSQFLIYGSKYLLNERTLSDYGIMSHAVLQMHVDVNYTYIFVEVNPNYKLKVRRICLYSSTIANVKERIFNKKGIPIEEQHLYFKGWEVRNDQILGISSGKLNSDGCLGMNTGDTLTLLRIEDV